MNNNRARATLIWVLIVFVLFGIFNALKKPTDPALGGGVPTIAYSDFMAAVENGRIDRVEFEGRSTLYGMYKKAEVDRISSEKPDATPHAPAASTPVVTIPTPERFQFQTLTPNDPQLVAKLLDKQVKVAVRPPEESGLLGPILFSFGPMILFLVAYVWIMNRMQGGKGGMNPFSFGKSRAKLLKPEENKVTWDDVKGVDEAKADLQEIVDFLKSPAKFRELGGRIPKGVLLVGSPGCGKTHLSRALAHEAGAHFFTLSGSDFVEMFVGVGASRVRDLFEQARKHSPAIIFIDEIDAVGRQRGAGVGGGNDEREQTLNALLVEMDGFDQSGGVIVIAATNRPDVLDSALLRPGRFDRQVVVPMPDIQGRIAILDVYVKNIPLSPDVKVDVVARSTPGFSGADLANLVNEAALFAARRAKKVVDMADFESAKDKIVMGAERRSTSMTDDEKKNTAYHESGHAIVSLALDRTDPVHKVTIVPRGQALGVTMMIPERDQYGHDREQLKQQIAVLLGGRLAEELFLNNMSTGASDDIRRATDLARKMVTLLGMSPKLGPVRYAEDEGGATFLGRSMMAGGSKNWSERTQEAVDEEIRRFVEEGYNTAKAILEDHQTEMHSMAGLLLEQETISAEDCARIMGKKKNKWSYSTTSMSQLALEQQGVKS
jgi:cell division protease FtsH